MWYVIYISVKLTCVYVYTHTSNLKNLFPWDLKQKQKQEKNWGIRPNVWTLIHFEESIKMSENQET